MSGAFFRLDLAVRALQAQQAGLDTTTHNVANANTPGFSRQAVEIATTEPYTVPGMNRAAGPGQIGTGAVAVGVQRLLNMFLDVQYRNERGAQRNAEVTEDALEEVEVVFAEPSDSGLSAMFNKYFNTWQELANDPSDTAVRTTVVQQSIALAEGLNRASRQLTDIRNNVDDELATVTTEVNNITAQMIVLNRQIVQVEIGGQRANDFRDQRDVLLDRLSELVQFTSAENADGSVNVTLTGGQALVTGMTATTLSTTDTNADGFYEVRFGTGGAAPLANLGNAMLGGLMAVRDTNLPSYLGKLDTMAANLITAVNGLHTTGYGKDGVTGRAFFTGTNAGTIAVNTVIAADSNKIGAASAAGQAGNNQIALQIAQLRQTMSPPTEEAYGSLISGLGVDTQSARSMAANQTSLVNLIDRRRQEISGVSLDEEAVQLLRYQRAYEAAARLITTADEMLDKLINGTGIVGR